MTDMSALYYKDPYMKEFDARVISCTQGKKGYEIVLSDTAFYPEGGGQPADHGFLNDVKVTDVHEKNDVIIHYCEKTIEPGTPVHGVIDWERRFDLMQNHSGEHILSGIIHRTFGYDNVGFHMGDVITIDFNGPLTWEQLKECERKANEVIQKNEEIIFTYPDEEERKTLEYRSKKELSGTVRICEIPSADICACCGTHVRRTGEIGLIKALSLEKHKNGVRCEMVSGMRAVHYMEEVFDNNREISFALSAPLRETSAYLKRLLEEQSALQRKIHDMTAGLLKQRLEQKEISHVQIDILENVDKLSMRNYCNDLLAKTDNGTAAVFVKDSGRYNYLVISKDTDLRPVSKQINAALNGKGGGNGEMIQGSVSCEEGQILSCMQSLLGKEAQS